MFSHCCNTALLNSKKALLQVGFPRSVIFHHTCKSLKYSLTFTEIYPACFLRNIAMTSRLLLKKKRRILTADWNTCLPTMYLHNKFCQPFKAAKCSFPYSYLVFTLVVAVQVNGLEVTVYHLAFIKSSSSVDTAEWRKIIYVISVLILTWPLGSKNGFVPLFCLCCGCFVCLFWGGWFQSRAMK